MALLSSSSSSNSCLFLSHILPPETHTHCGEHQLENKIHFFIACCSLLGTNSVAHIIIIILPAVVGVMDMEYDLHFLLKTEDETKQQYRSALQARRPLDQCTKNVTNVVPSAAIARVRARVMQQYKDLETEQVRSSATSMNEPQFRRERRTSV